MKRCHFDKFYENVIQFCVDANTAVYSPYVFENVGSNLRLASQSCGRPAASHQYALIVETGRGEAGQEFSALSSKPVSRPEPGRKAKGQKTRASLSPSLPTKSATLSTRLLNPRRPQVLSLFLCHRLSYSQFQVLVHAVDIGVAFDAHSSGLHGLARNV